MPIGLIGGTGMSDLFETELNTERVNTPFGAVAIRRGTWAGHEVGFIARHGLAEARAPHQICYQANISALQHLGCTHIIATNAVGAIREDIKPGDLALPHQFLDFTKTRSLTLLDTPDAQVRHTDFTEPYSPYLRARLAQQARALGLCVHEDVVYVCTEGPRFETPAEIRMFALLGGDVVGMTGVPEVVFAHEADIAYASICIATNYAAGRSAQPLTAEEVHEVMQQRRPELVRLLEGVVSRIEPQMA